MADIKNAITVLKPCPFCGGTKLFVGTIAESEGQDSTYPDYDYNCQLYTVVCSFTAGGCGAATGGTCHTEDEAIEAWNRRADNGPIRN